MATPEAPEPHFHLLQWGLIPSWAKTPTIGSRLINARSETVSEKPSFRTAFKRRRCLVLADGFYGWQKQVNSKAKQPHYSQDQDNTMQRLLEDAEFAKTVEAR